MNLTGRSSSIRSIVFLTYHFPPEVGGIQVRLSRYIGRLTGRGVKVRVLVAGRTPTSDRRFEGAEIIQCQGGIKHLPRNLVRMAQTTITARPDVVHVFTGASTLLGLGSLVVARSVGAKAVISFFGREDFVYSGTISRMLFLLAIAAAESIDVNSSATGAMLPKSTQRKVHFLMGAADESRGNVMFPRGSKTILFVGRLVRRKGVDDLLNAFAIVRPQFPEAKMSIVGDGPERSRLTELATSLGLGDSVEFKGTRVGGELDLEYTNSSVVVLPSKDDPSDIANEGLGLTLIEASMHGKPLIGTTHGGIPEVVLDHENGLLVPPGEPLSIARALTEILGNDELALRLGKRGLEIARSRFGWDHATDVLLQSYA